MAVITEGKYVSDVLKYEQLNDMSRETVTIESGAGVLGIGAVLGQKTANGKWLLATVATTGGLETPRAVLLEAVDATSADKKAIVVRRGPAKVNANALTWGAAYTTQTLKDAGAVLLEAASNIIARRGA